MTQLNQPATSFHQSHHSPYYIVSPNFSQKSSGPRMLHYLCHTLNELGYEAYITARAFSPWLRTPELTREIRLKHRETGRTPIAVYPEVACGNPLQEPVVARWILNKAGHLGGHKEFHPDELLFYWDEWVLQGEQNADRLFLPSVDDRIFNDHDIQPEDRSGFCYYAHKYLMFGGQIAEPITRDGISLCQDIPRTAEEIAHILRTSRVLYCYEPSNIVAEAYACGCPAILVQTDYLKQFDLNRLKIVKVPESDIDFSFIPPIGDRLKDAMEADKARSWDAIRHFIDKTQAAARAHKAYAEQPEQKLKAAISAFQANMLVEATDIFSPLLDALPESPLPPAYLAFICAAQGLAQEAREFMDRAMEIAPDRADLKAALGESFLKAGQPGLAAEYLEEAVHLQPDMLSAYPALARSLHLTQQSDTALALLKGAAQMSSSAQAHIQTTLLEILAEQGNIAEFSQACLRYSNGIADDLLAVRCLSRFDASGERLVEALGAAQARLASQLPGLGEASALPIKTAQPWKIAFLTSDLAREEQQGRLKALLNHLPPEQFVTTLIINDPKAGLSHFAQACSLVADHTLVIHDQGDSTALERLNANPADILIDLDSYGPADRLSLFVQAQAGVKLLWGEAPMPALAPDCLPLQGELLADQAMLPGIILPGLGECCELPELPITPAPGTPTLGCLTPAVRIGPEGWRLFAEVLQASPDSQLLLNLMDLGDSARAYITRQFTQAGVAASRLRFVHAHTREALCQYWQEVQLGLAPPVDAGDQALTTCLWMGRPFVALAASLPWSHRPAALLHCAGASAWIADSASRYVELASRLPQAPDPSLRARLRAAGLDDPAVFARGFAATMADLMQTAPAPSPAP